MDPDGHLCALALEERTRLGALFGDGDGREGEVLCTAGGAGDGAGGEDEGVALVGGLVDDELGEVGGGGGQLVADGDGRSDAIALGGDEADGVGRGVFGGCFGRRGLADVEARLGSRGDNALDVLEVGLEGLELVVLELGGRSQQVKSGSGVVREGTYHVVDIHPALGICYQALVLLVVLVNLLLGDGPLEDEHETLGDADVAVLVDAVAAAAVVLGAILGLEAHAPAAAMARGVVHEGAGGEHATDVVVHGRVVHSDGSGHFYWGSGVCLGVLVFVGDCWGTDAVREAIVRQRRREDGWQDGHDLDPRRARGRLLCDKHAPRLADCPAHHEPDRNRKARVSWMMHRGVAPLLGH